MITDFSGRHQNLYAPLPLQRGEYPRPFLLKWLRHRPETPIWDGVLGKSHRAERFCPIRKRLLVLGTEALSQSDDLVVASTPESAARGPDSVGWSGSYSQMTAHLETGRNGAPLSRSRIWSKWGSTLPKSHLGS